RLDHSRPAGQAWARAPGQPTATRAASSPAGSARFLPAPVPAAAPDLSPGGAGVALRRAPANCHAETVERSGAAAPAPALARRDTGPTVQLAAEAAAPDDRVAVRRRRSESAPFSLPAAGPRARRAPARPRCSKTIWETTGGR